jgi:hypothetical protein
MGEYTYLIMLAVFASCVYASGVLIERLQHRKRAHSQRVTTAGLPAAKPVPPRS